MSDQLTANFSGKGMTKNFLELMAMREKFKKCCESWLTQVYTEDSETVTFSGLGTEANPLTASVIPDTVLFSANDGLSVIVTPDSSFVKLGQSIGQMGSPASLIEDREIPMQGFSIDFLDNSLTDFSTSTGIFFSNNTPATASTNQFPPIIGFHGAGWNSVDEVSRTTDWYISMQPNTWNISGNGFSQMSIYNSDNGGPNNQIIEISQQGDIFTTFINGNLDVDGNVIATAAVISQTVGGANSVFLTVNPSGSEPNTAYLGINGSNPAAIRITNSLESNGNSEFAEFGWLKDANIFTINMGTVGAGILRTMTILSQIAFGTAIAPTANIHITKGGTAAAGDGQFKLIVDSALKTVPETGLFEFDGTNLYFTVAGVRKTFTLS